VPDQDAGLRLVQLPAFGLLASVVVAAERRASGRMTHVLPWEGHFWGHKEVAIPVSVMVAWTTALAWCLLSGGGR
jgi:hypothetical protein